MAVEVEGSLQLFVSFVAVLQTAAEKHFYKMASDLDVHTKQRCVLNSSMRERISPVDIHGRLLNIYGDQTVDVRTVRRWVVRFSRGGSDVRDRPRWGRPCTAASSRNEVRLDQLIRSNRLLRPGNSVRS
jgi:hypothetical protein